MKKRYVLAIVLAAFMRVQSRAQGVSEPAFGPQRVVVPEIAGGVRASFNGIYPADLDGDNDQDILAISSADSATYWYRNDGQGNFGEQQAIASTLRYPIFLYAYDLDSDGDQDLIIDGFDKSLKNRYWHENDGQGNFTERRIMAISSGIIYSLYPIDLDGDGDQDIITSTDNTDAYWYENDGRGNFTRRQVIESPPADYGYLYTADIDGDDDLDVVSAYTTYFGTEIFWFENDGEGNLGKPQKVVSNSDNSASPISITDVDGDGDPDVVLSSSFSFKDTDYERTIGWYPNDGKGTFGERQIIATAPPENRSLPFIHATDLDGDGDQDILAASNSDYSKDDEIGVDDEAKIVWYQNDGQGLFKNEQIIATKDNPTQSINTTDLDGDGDQDILSSNILPSRDDVQRWSITWYENLLSIPSIPTVTNLALFNARTNARVQILNDGDVIDLLNLTLRDYNIQANVVAAGETVTRVNFDLTAPARQDTMTTEFRVPYTLYGDKPNGDFRPRKAYDGDYQLTVTPYYKDSTGNETKGVSKTVNFTFVARGLRARNIRMIDTRDNSVIERLDNGDVISLAANQPVSILVDSRYPQYNSMEFFLDGPSPDGKPDVQALESLAPFALFGDIGRNRDPNGKPLKAGDYEIRVIPYQGKRRASYAGPEEIVRFTIVDDASERQELAYPVPFTNELNLRTEPVDLANLRIRFVHSYGQVYEVSSDQITVTEDGLLVNVADLPAGPYTIQLQQADQVQTFRGSKE